MEIVVVIVLVFGVWWLFRSAGPSSSAAALGIAFKEIEADCEWWRSWRTFQPSFAKPKSFFQNHITALFEGGGIAVFQSVLPAATRFREPTHDGFTLLAEHQFEPGDRIEVRDLSFRMMNYDWVSQQGGGGFWKVHPHNERGASIVLFKSSGHIAKLVELPYVGADMDAANIAADLRAVLAKVVPTPDTPAPQPGTSPTAGSEGFEL